MMTTLFSRLRQTRAAQLLTPRALSIAVFGAAVMVASCDSPFDPRGGKAELGRVAVYANTAGTAVNGIVIEVSGPGIVKEDATTPDTLVFNLSILDGIASGSLDIPAGDDRHIVVHAFTDAVETHRGETTTDISSGTNATVQITLFPITGNVPITLTLGSLVIVVQPDSVFVGLGDTIRATAQVRDQNNAIVSTPVIWGTSNAARATVDTGGLITVRDTGAVFIIATQGGVAGMSRIYGKRFPVPATSYTLVWDGSKNRSWSDTANWTAQNGDDSRVPTAADSVIIPSGIVNQPRLDFCGVSHVRDLVMEPSATLTTTCSGTATRLRVYNSAHDVNVAVAVEPQSQSSLSGTFGILVLLSDTVSLAGNASAQQVDLSMDGELTLGGHTLFVSGALTLADTSALRMSQAADTVNVRGAVTILANSRSALSAGVFRVGGSPFNANISTNAWAPTGTHETIFDGTSLQFVNTPVGGFAATWPNVRIANATRVVFSGNPDTLDLPNFRIDSTKVRLDFNGSSWNRIIPEGGTLTIGSGGLFPEGTANLIIDGNVVLPAAATLTPTIGGGLLKIRDGTLTVAPGTLVNVATLALENSNLVGTVASANTILSRGVHQDIAPGVAAFNGMTLRDSSRLVVGSGTSVLMGGLSLADSSGLIMTDAADTLSVRGIVDVTGNTRSELSAGVLRAGSTFNGNIATNAWAPTGTHETIFDGTTLQFVNTPVGGLAATWPNVRIANATRIIFSGNPDTLDLPNFRIDSTKVRLDFSGSSWNRIIPEDGTLTVGSGGLFPDGGANLIIDGNVVLPAAATLTPTIGGGLLKIRDGTLTVAPGTLVNVATLALENTTLAGTVASQNAILSRGVHQDIAPGVAAFRGITLRDSSRLVVGSGTSVLAAGLSLADSSGLIMTDAADTLSVRGIVDVTGNTRNDLSAGVFRAGSAFNGNVGTNAWAPTGTHETIFDGTTLQFVNTPVGGIAATWPNVRVANATRVIFSGNPDTLDLPNFRIDSTKVRVDFSGSSWSRIIPEGGTLTVGSGGLFPDGGANLIVDGNVVLPAAATLTPTIGGGLLKIRDGTLTVASGTLVNVSTLALDNSVVTGLVDANEVIISNGAQLTLVPGVTQLRKSVTLLHNSRLIVGSGKSVMQGTLSINDVSGVVMTDAADTLSVRGIVNVGNSSQNELTAGVFRVGSTFNGNTTNNTWNPTGTHELILDGTSLQFVNTPVGGLAATWPNVRIANPTRIIFSGNPDTLDLPNFRIDSTKVRLDFSGSSWTRIVPEGGTLTVGTGGFEVAGGANLIVDGNVVLPAKVGAIVPSITGGFIQIMGDLTTGTGSLFSANVRLYGALNPSGTMTPSTIDFAGEEQNAPASLDYGTVIVSGNVTFDGTYVTSSSCSITGTGVMNVTLNSYVQCGRLAGMGFSMVNGAQLFNQGIVRYTSASAFTVPAGASVVGNNPASTAPAHILVLTHPEPTGTADSAVQTMPVFRVLDAIGYPLKNITVNMSVVAGGSQITGISPVTDTNGVVTLGTWKLGPTATVNVVAASVPGATGASVQVSSSYARRLQVGANSACARANNSSVYCWGDARAWQFGADPSTFGTDTAYKLPVVTALGPFQSVSFGFGEHLCGIDASNNASCWGRGGNGELGNGSAGNAGNAPVTVSGGIQWREISRGREITCGVSTTDVGYCWGKNNNGVIDAGQSFTTVFTSPVQVAGGLAWKTISVGWKHACGITTTGATYCWGSNSHGQLGINSGTSQLLTPSTPISVGTGTHPGAAVQVAVAAYHSCIVTTAYKVWCWGDNSSGQLGNAISGGVSTKPVETAGSLRFTQVAAGSWFSHPMPLGVTAPSAPGEEGQTCALAEDGKPYCWGYNVFGQVGDGTTFLRESPTAVGGTLRLNSISVGETGACGNRGGTAWCWGAGALGRNGNNSTTNVNFPARVGSPF